MLSKYSTLFVIIFLYFSPKIQAQNIIHLTPDQVRFNLNTEVIEIFQDPSKQLNFLQVQKQKFVISKQRNINAGYTDAKFWYRVKVKNTLPKRWIFVMVGSMMDKIEFFEIKPNGSIRKRVSGDHYPHSSREFESPLFTFYLDIPQNETFTLYLSVESEETKQFNLSIQDIPYFTRTISRDMFKWFFYFGMLFMMMIYNLLLYFSVRDKTYLLYVLYIANFGMLQFTIFGYGTQFIWGNSPWIADRATSFFTGGSTIFISLFSYKFLNINFFFPKLKIAYIYLILCGFVIASINLINPSIHNSYFIAIISLFNTLLIVFFGILVMRKGYPPARYYMTAWGVLFFAIIIFISNATKILPDNNINYLILPFGSVAEVILLSLGLGNRINTIENEKAKAQEEAMKQLHEKEEVRSRIARDLHDDLGSTLSSIRILSEFAHNETISHPEKVPSLLDRITNSTQKLQENLQDIVWTTQTKDNTFEELIARMRLFGGEILEAKNINYHFSIDSTISQVQLSPNIQYDIFMIFKESIHNIVKYANAKNVEVDFGLKNNLLTLHIKDDGVGFDCTHERNGNGLKNMPRRAENINGKITINSTIGQGTNVVFTMPVPI
jgi:signal transduction histidine kinase